MTRRQMAQERSRRDEEMDELLLLSCHAWLQEMAAIGREVRAKLTDAAGFERRRSDAPWKEANASSEAIRQGLEWPDSPGADQRRLRGQLRALQRWSWSEPLPPCLELMDCRPRRGGPSPAGVDALTDAMEWLASGRAMPPGFNGEICALPPKKILGSDGVESLREPADAMPIALKGAGAKATSSAANARLSAAAMRVAPHSQRHFVKHRIFLDSAIEMDGFARVALLRAGDAGHAQPARKGWRSPIPIIFDFTLAFRSSRRYWIGRAFQRRLWRPRIGSSSRAATSAAWALPQRAAMLLIVSGVLHGDPPSGTGFALAAASFARARERQSERCRPGLTCRRANDVDAVAVNLEGARFTGRIFCAGERLASLALKLQECFCAPYAGLFLPEAVESMRQELGSACTGWSKVAPACDCCGGDFARPRDSLLRDCQSKMDTILSYEAQ
ncbi:unnamed protein product, partial [Prorocentrum cordatum]